MTKLKNIAAIADLRVVLSALLLGSASFFLAACESQGPAEEAGESIDEAAEEAGDSLEEATDN